jgi:hypothetical protein
MLRRSATPHESIGVSLNLQFLGDALDHWKGSLFESLRMAEALRDFAVDPMASDLDSWRQEDFKLFARLLRITPAQIIRHRVTLEERVKYFGEISHRGDLFLDPDTGVATGPVKKALRYVNPSEIGQLLNGSPNRLLIVYQHVRGQPVASRVDEVLDTLRHEIGGFSWCSYESGTVAMLFLARLPMRTAAIAEHFEALLGRHAAGRIRRSEFRP